MNSGVLLFFVLELMYSSSARANGEGGAGVGAGGLAKGGIFRLS